jgi:hypothetical protein
MKSEKEIKQRIIELDEIRNGLTKVYGDSSLCFKLGMDSHVGWVLQNIVVQMTTLIQYVLDSKYIISSNEDLERAIREFKAGKESITAKIYRDIDKDIKKVKARAKTKKKVKKKK